MGVPTVLYVKHANAPVGAIHESPLVFPIVWAGLAGNIRLDKSHQTAILI